MLVEIFSPVFKEKNIIRSTIKFKNGLNVIQGDNGGANSIGKSSALLAIDFSFGGDAYLNSDGVKYLGNHVIYFCFKFERKYYFARNTENPDEIIICNKEYTETNNTIKKNEFSTFLMEKYNTYESDFSFRQLVSTYFRIYGKHNIEENYPLQSYRNQSTKESIKILLSLLDYYSKIKPYHERLETESDKLKTFKNARKYSFIPNLVGGLKTYEANRETLKELKAELESLTDSSNNTNTQVTQDDIDKSKYYEELKSNKLFLEAQLERLQRRHNLLSVSLECGLMPTEADIQGLIEFFPTANIKKIFEVENYHRKLSKILNTEFEKENESLNIEINNLKNNIDKINSELLFKKINNKFSKEFLDKYSALQRQIYTLEKQNEAFKEEKTLSNLKQLAKDKLESNLSDILSNVTFELNKKMRELNDKIYKEKRNSPHIALKNYNNYNFSTPQDSGTGTNFRGLILFDLSMLYLSYLPAISHDSLLFKNIDDEGIDGIIKIYNEVYKINKQIFISFDKQSSYSQKTYEILNNNCVLQLGNSGNELYGKAWNKEIKNETNL
jgi:DNA repair ATPase|nr:MAG TPA: STRUCTURAL MAINTENANCE OF CHROMOSOMES PROTEIN BINDING, COHESIN, MITOSIS, CHROMOSOME [Caudoviricetes sp.]